MKSALSYKLLAAVGSLAMVVGCGGEPLADEATEPSLGSASQQLVSRTYQVIAVHSNKCMDVSGASQVNGASIIQWDCHGGDNQLFFPIPREDGTFSFIAWHSGKCLDVRGASTADGAPLIQYECHGGANQRFYVQEWPNRNRLVAKHSGKCVDVSGASTANGALYIQYTCHGGANQSFILR